VPQHESSYAEFLYFSRQVRQFERSPLAASRYMSLVINDSGHLLSFGSTIPVVEAEEDTQLFPGSLHGRRQQRHACPLGRGSKFKTVVIPRPIIRLRPRIWSCAAGEYHCLALSEAGHVSSWGSNTHGQCGRLQDREHLATASPGLVWPRFSRSDRDSFRFGCIVAIESYSAALSLDGHLYEWGQHPVISMLFHVGVNVCFPVPTRKDGSGPHVREAARALHGVRLSRLSAGSAHLLVLTREGRALSWGDGSTGALGHEVLWTDGQILNDCDESRWCVPRVIEAPSSVRLVAVAAGPGYSLAVDAEGAVWGWGGDGWTGTHGSGAGDPPCLPTRVLSLAAHKITTVFASDGMAMATTD